MKYLLRKAGFPFIYIIFMATIALGINQIGGDNKLLKLICSSLDLEIFKLKSCEPLLITTKAFSLEDKDDNTHH